MPSPYSASYTARLIEVPNLPLSVGLRVGLSSHPLVAFVCQPDGHPGGRGHLQLSRTRAVEEQSDIHHGPTKPKASARPPAPASASVRHYELMLCARGLHGLRYSTGNFPAGMHTKWCPISHSWVLCLACWRPSSHPPAPNLANANPSLLVLARTRGTGAGGWMERIHAKPWDAIHPTSLLPGAPPTRSW